MEKKKILAAALAMGLAFCTPVQVLAEEMPVLEIQEAVEEVGVRETVEDTEIQDVKDDAVSDVQPEEEIAEQNSNAGNSVFVVTSDEDILDNTAKDMKAMESSQPEEEPEKEAEKEIERKGSILAEGKSGDLSWSIDSEGCFTLEGTGDYELNSEYEDEVYNVVPPWYKYRNKIKKANIKVEKITNLCELFYRCHNLTSVNWNNSDTSQVEDMAYMFYECEGLKKVDLRILDTSQVKNMSGMFSECDMKGFDISILDTSQVKNMSYMFYGCKNMMQLDLGSFNTSQVRDMSGMFSASDIIRLNLSGFDTSQVINMSSIFAMCTDLMQLELSDFDTSQVTNMSHMFSGCRNLTQLNLKSFDTSQVTDMSDMFGSCSGLVQLEIKGFNTQKVTDMGMMFCYCESLTELNLSNFDTTQVTNMGHMFSGCSSLKQLNLSDFNTSQVTDMSGMFVRCESLTELNLSNFDTSQVINMGWMFDCASNLKQLDLSNFNTSQVTNMHSMFWGCRNLTQLKIEGFDTSKVRDMSSMFYRCSSLKQLNLKNFVTSQVTSMLKMFYKCSNLQQLDLSGFDMAQVEETMSDAYDEEDYVSRGMLTDCGARIIQTPRNLKVETRLPDCEIKDCEKDRWKGIDGKIYTNLPMNSGTSIMLTRIAGPGHRYESTTTKASVSKNGSVKKKCTVCGKSPKATVIYYPKTIKLSLSSYTYNGKVRKPSVKILGSNGKTIASTNYTVSYASGRKNVGRYKVKITFKGNYKGSVTKTFDIVPKGTSISRVTAVKKGFTVKWKKQKMQTTGYQIQYSTSGNFKKGTKAATINKNSVTSKNIKGLKAKKKYYVRVRTYKTVKINGKSTKLYSGWSKVKAVKTKK